MVGLSSCYFCGVALDEPLEEHPVVPDSLRPAPDTQATVVVCPTCRRKLERVHEYVLAAVEERSGVPEGGSAVEGRAGAETDPATLQESTERGRAEEETESEKHAPDTSIGASAQGTEDSDAPSGDDPAKRSVDEADIPGESAQKPDVDPSEVGPAGDPEPVFGSEGTAEDTAGRDPYEPTFEDDEATGEGPEPEIGATGTGTTGQGEEAETPAEPGAGTQTEPRDDEEGNDVDQDIGSSSDGESTPDGAEGDESKAASSSASGSSFPTAETYNRVVRLLQNREFPVERADIEAVATNAYEISPSEFEAVIRTAVKRGVLEEEEGMLVLPDAE